MKAGNLVLKPNFQRAKEIIQELHLSIMLKEDQSGRILQ